MPKEKSAGAIVFKENGGRKYLLLLYKGKNFKYWEFARGRIEKNEKESDTIVREVEEETGINDLEFTKDFNEKINFFYKRDDDIIFKEVIYILARTKKKDVKLSQEHLDYCWAGYEEALNKLKFRNDKEILKKAEEFLEKHDR